MLVFEDDQLFFGISFYSFLGLLIGSITMELGGVVNIRCEKTGYNAEIEFKLKVLFVFFSG